MSMAKITEQLKARPQGMSGQELAEVLDRPFKGVDQSLIRLARYGMAYIEAEGRTRAQNVWKLLDLSDHETPPIYRAMEMLHAFQVAARAKQQLAEIGVA